MSTVVCLFKKCLVSKMAAGKSSELNLMEGNRRGSKERSMCCLKSTVATTLVIRKEKWGKKLSLV